MIISHLTSAALFGSVAVMLIVLLAMAIQRGTTFARWHLDIDHHRKRYLSCLIAASMLAGACLVIAAELVREGSLA